MRIGMLWFDNSKSDLATKVERAATYYRNKYGKVPNLCYVHPAMTRDGKAAGGVEIRTSRQVMPNHLWIGVNHADHRSP